MTTEPAGGSLFIFLNWEVDEDDEDGEPKSWGWDLADLLMDRYVHSARGCESAAAAITEAQAWIAGNCGLRLEWQS